MPSIDELRRECWTKRLYSFGTSKIFEKRASALDRKRKVIVFLGLLSPVVIGAFAAAFSIESETLKLIIIPLAGAITVTQAAFSLWSLVAGWDKEYEYSVESLKANNSLAAQFETLAKSDDEAVADGIVRLRHVYERQDDSDCAHHISDRERRFGYRAALFQYRSPCPTCGRVPDTLKPSKCDSCGNF